MSSISSPAPAPAASYVGAFINLDRSPERRQEMEAQLAALGIADRYVRFRAIDGNPIANYKGPLRPGEVGSFLSHFKAIEQLRGHEKPIHIMEDDALMSRQMAPMIEFAIGQGIFNYFDIVFTELYLAFEYLSSIRFHKRMYDEYLVNAQTDPLKAFKVLSLEGQIFFGLSSYVVSATAVDRVLSFFRQEAEAGPRVANDIFVNRLLTERKLRVGYLFPFVTSLNMERALDATVSGRNSDRFAAITFGSNLIRYSFYVERDLAGQAAPMLDRMAAQYVTRPRNEHQEFINRAMEYVVMVDEPT